MCPILSAFLAERVGYNQARNTKTEKPLLLFQFRNRRQHFLGVVRGIHLDPLLHDLALRIDEEGVAVGDLEGGKAAQRAIRIDDLMLRVGEQPEGQPFLGAELLVAVGRVQAHAQNYRVGGVKFRLIALEVVRLNRAAGVMSLG